MAVLCVEPTAARAILPNGLYSYNLIYYNENKSLWLVVAEIQSHPINGPASVFPRRYCFAFIIRWNPDVSFVYSVGHYTLIKYIYTNCRVVITSLTVNIQHNIVRFTIWFCDFDDKISARIFNLVKISVFRYCSGNRLAKMLCIHRVCVSLVAEILLPNMPKYVVKNKKIQKYVSVLN